MNLSRRALIAAAVTGMLPAGAEAALFNQNLVTNPSFESTSGINALNWTGNASTYAYSANYTGPGPAGSGLNYWNGAGGAADPAHPLAFQILDLTGNAIQIDSGQVNYNLSAFFSTYLLQLDYGSVRALFLNAGNAQVGSATVGGAVFTAALPVVGNSFDPNTRAWGQDSLSGGIPVGTRTVRLEVAGEKQPGVGNAADGYIDLVNFQIVPEPSTWALLGLSLLAGRWCFGRRRG